jgi:hypothetical protein
MSIMYSPVPGLVMIRIKPGRYSGGLKNPAVPLKERDGECDRCAFSATCPENPGQQQIAGLCFVMVRMGTDMNGPETAAAAGKLRPARLCGQVQALSVVGAKGIFQGDFIPDKERFRCHRYSMHGICGRLFTPAGLP